MDVRKVIFTKETEIPLNKIWLKIKSFFTREPKVKPTYNYNWDNTVPPQNPETIRTGVLNYPFFVTGKWEPDKVSNLVSGELPKEFYVSGISLKNIKLYDESKN